jgi:hypothetical protein
VRPTPLLRRARALVAIGSAVVVVGLTLGACGGGGPSAGDQRADQVRQAAREAGLPREVADVLALAARGSTATFQITYAGTEGATLVVSQEGPNRRVDVVSGSAIVESRVLRDGVGYRCEPATGTAAKPGTLTCRRAAGDLGATGTFTDAAITTFTKELAASRSSLDLTVKRRTIAKAEATCLVSAPKGGTPLDGTDDPSADTLCVSAEGAQLLVDGDGERLVAAAYTTEVPDGTFDV